MTGLVPAASRLAFWLMPVLWAALLLALGRAFLQERPWRALPAVDLLFLGLVVAAGALLRFAPAPLPSDIRPATDLGFVVGYVHWGAAYGVFLRALYAVFGPSLEIACAANAALGTISIVALYAFGVLYLEDRRAALAAAAFLAFHPICARYSASDSAHVLGTLALLCALCCAAAWARRRGRAWLAQAAGWMALAANARSESVAASVAVAAVLFCAPGRRAEAFRFGRAEGLVALGWALAGVLLPMLTDAEVLSAAASAGNLGGVVNNPWFLSAATPRLAVALSVAGLASFALEPAFRGRGAAWLVGTAAAALPTMFSPEPSYVTNYRYFLPVLALFCLAAGQGVGALGRAAERFAPGPAARLAAGAALVPLAVVALAGVGSLPAMGFLRRTWTHQLESAFVRDTLRRIPDDCVIVRLSFPISESGLELSPYLSPLVGRRHCWAEVQDALAGGVDEPCVVYYQGATCLAAFKTSAGGEVGTRLEERRECREMRERFRWEPVAETVLPAAPYVNEVYLSSALPVGFYRLSPRGGAGRPGGENPASARRRDKRSR